MGYNDYLAVLIASALLSCALAIFFWRRHPAPGARSMAGLAAAAFMWSAGYIVEVLTTTPASRHLANDIEYVGLVSIPVLWFVFAAQYARSDNWVIRHSYLLAAVPIITLVLVWTNGFHGLIWRSVRLENYGQFLIGIKTYGPWFWFHSLYSYVLVLAGIAILARRLSQPVRLYRIQIMLLLFVAVLSLIWSVIFVFRLPPTYHIDMTPPAFVLSGLVVALGLFRFRMLDIVPIARDRVVDNMDDGVIVLDGQGRVLDLNRAAQAIVGQSVSALVGMPVSMLWPERPELERHLSGNGNKQAELAAGSGDNLRHYEPRIMPLYDRRGSRIGQVVSLHDVTEWKRTEEELRALSRKVVRLQEEERCAISRELHDEVGQMLTYLALQLDRAGRLQPDGVAGALQEARTTLADTIQQVRDLSHSLRPPMLEAGLLPALHALTGKLAAAGCMPVELDHAEVVGLAEELNLTVYRIVQEALTNVVRHARAGRVSVRLRCNSGVLHLEIEDDGAGFDAARRTQTAGLTGMQERARSVGGVLRVESAPGAGTRVIATLPVAGQVPEIERNS